ncbi:hypothetical protein AOX55_0000146 [Sinorhizobium fredii CCBAU 25509]|nr:hypothetical protein AOX55_0000146 [Sinorhizobium fredii CCBAU 25509]
MLNGRPAPRALDALGQVRECLGEWLGLPKLLVCSLRGVRITGYLALDFSLLLVGDLADAAG